MEAKAADAKGVDYTITELYKRILKVEKLAEKVKITTGAERGHAKVTDLNAGLARRFLQ